jgi:hypothetical protein
MSSHGVVFLILTVAFPVVITELLLLLCWRTFGDRGAYPWYSCILRTAAYSPCILVGTGGFTPLPLSTAFFLNVREAGSEIVWLYGLPEIFVGIVSALVSFGIRLMNTPAGKANPG